MFNMAATEGKVLIDKFIEINGAIEVTTLVLEI